jgi:hypothetical protein
MLYVPWGVLSFEVLPIVSISHDRRLAHFPILVFLGLIDPFSATKMPMWKVCCWHVRVISSTLSVAAS